jgi:hypothetical protein
MITCGIKKSWRDERERPIEMLPIEVWLIPECVQVKIEIHPETSFVTGVRFLPGIPRKIIFGCNLGIQICHLLKVPSYSVFGRYDGEISMLELSACAKYVAVAYSKWKSSVIVVWKLGDPETQVFSMMADARVVGMKFSPGLHMLIVYLDNEVLQFHSLHSLECCFEKKVAGGDKLELSPDGKMLFVIGFLTIFSFEIEWDY